MANEAPFPTLCHGFWMSKLGCGHFHNALLCTLVTHQSLPVQLIMHYM